MHPLAYNQQVNIQPLYYSEAQQEERKKQIEARYRNIVLQFQHAAQNRSKASFDYNRDILVNSVWGSKDFSNQQVNNFLKEAKIPLTGLFMACLLAEGSIENEERPALWLSLYQKFIENDQNKNHQLINKIEEVHKRVITKLEKQQQAQQLQHMYASVAIQPNNDPHYAQKQAALEAHNAYLKQEIAGYQQELFQQSNVTQELSDSLQLAHSKLYDLTSKYNEAIWQTTQLKSMNASQIGSDKQMINELEDKLSKLSSQYKELNNSKMESVITCERLSSENTQLKQKLASSAIQLDGIKKENSDLIMEKSQLTQKIDIQNKELAQLKAEKEKLSSQITTLLTNVFSIAQAVKDPISLDLPDDEAMLTPEGQILSKEGINWVKTNGKNPCTNTPLPADKLYPALPIREIAAVLKNIGTNHPNLFDDL